MVTTPTTRSPRRLRANGITIDYDVAGTGPVILLLHGWPHTRLVWRDVMTALADDYTVIAPDLRGLGGTSTPGDGYDLHTLADDAAALLTALGIDRVALVAGIDLGAPVAFMLAARHRALVDRLALMEALLGRQAGAEDFLGAGPPWWFGFHSVADLPEAVLTGHSDSYIDWFLHVGTHDRAGVDEEMRAAFITAYRDPAVLHAGFEHYRAMAGNAELIAEAARHPLELPVLALGADTVGDALRRQLAPTCHDLRGEVLPDCGHIIPADAPRLLADRLARFIGQTDRAPSASPGGWPGDGAAT